MNNTPVMAYRNREWVKITWADVLVGDILMVHARHTSFLRAPHLPACLPAVCVVWIICCTAIIVSLFLTLTPLILVSSQIKDGHAFPADLVLLQSHSRQGVCNIGRCCSR